MGENRQRGRHTEEEIESQPEAWSRALEVVGAQASALQECMNGFDEVVFTGCGSTYYLALAAAALFRERTGVRATGLPASEVWLYPRSALRTERATLLVAVSRSGATTETLRAVESFKQRVPRGRVLTLSCYPESDLPKLGHLDLVFESGQERSVAQTRAFSVLYLATVALAALRSGRDLEPLARLPEVGRRVLGASTDLAKRLGTDSRLDRFYVLGSGPRYGLACELSLKMKEMSLSHSEPFHFLEFRHGPQSMVTDSTLVIGLVSEENSASERAVLDEMRERGATTMLLAEEGADVAFGSAVPEAFRNVLYLPPVQRLAFERSLSRHLDPDRPHNLEAVVVLDGEGVAGNPEPSPSGARRGGTDDGDR